MSSPYKKIKMTNKQWVPYVNLSKLHRNKAYRMEGLVETNHTVYGKGQQATIKSVDGTMYRTQLPGKYLANLKPDMIDVIKKDIVEGCNPYLVYREQMLDNSYRLDILEKCPENDSLFSSSTDIPEQPIVISDDEEEKDTEGQDGAGLNSSTMEGATSSRLDIKQESV